MFIFDYRKLRGRIIEKYGSITNFAKVFGSTETTLGRKLSTKSYWSQDEIMKACKLLDIAIPELTKYFFCENS